MSKKVIKMRLETNSINSAIKELQAYKNSLPGKCEKFIRTLAEYGIQVAQENKGKYGTYITFSVSTDPDEYSCSGVFLASESGKVVSSWLTADGVKSVDVSPLLMAEFGSGWMASNPMNVSGVGQGTFPGQTHAFDEDGWYWTDTDGNRHHSKGFKPTMPVYKAAMEMRERIVQAAKEAFSDG